LGFYAHGRCFAYVSIIALLQVRLFTFRTRISFLLYEFAGIIANFIGGWLATRFGIARMLAVGLFTQITGFVMLSALSPEWTAASSVAWVVIAQGICGVAKDLTKTASKSAIKITASDIPGQLFKWVAWFTGSKNAMKGVGFFLVDFFLIPWDFVKHYGRWRSCLE
jgi:hypothetical protein